MTIDNGPWTTERLEYVAEILARVPAGGKAIVATLQRTVETEWAKFDGDDDERGTLIDIIHRHATCEDDCCDRDESACEPYCSVHAMLYDQRVMNGLVFARRIAWKLRAEEQSVLAPAVRAPFHWIAQKVRENR